jgi:hypothetical protein
MRALARHYPIEGVVVGLPGSTGALPFNPARAAIALSATAAVIIASV